MVRIDTLRILSKCFKILANQFYEWYIYTCINAKEYLTNAVAKFTNALRMKHQHDACVLYAYTVLPLFLFFLFASTCSISLFSFKISLLSAFFLYSIRMLENLYKRLTITTNALLLIRMACYCLRICCKYAFLTEFRNMFLIFAISLEQSECLRIRTNVWPL